MALRILHIIPTVNPASGGPIEGLRQLARCHQSFGHQVEIASLDPPAAPWLAFPGVPVHPMRSRWHERWLPLTLIRWLHSHHHQFDAVVINGIWNFHLCATWLVLRSSSTPYLVFTHGMLDPWFRWRYPLKHLKKWLAWPWAMYPALRDADAVCFTCEQERLLARHSFWLYDANEQVVSYGTQGLPEAAADLAGPFLQAHPPLAGRHRLLFLGRVAPKKAPDLLLRAIARLQREGLWDPAAMVLVLAGPAEDRYAQRLQRLAAQLCITDSLHWTGMLQGDQKWGAFQAADAFVLASHQENFGIAVAEALSCATPVLLSHAVNIAPEIVADGAGLVDTDTPAGVTRLLRRWLLLPPAERTAMAANARRCFEQRYHIAAASRSLTRTIHLAKLQRQLQKLGG